MSNVIQIKSGSGQPGAGVLQKAELGYDLINGYLYIGDSNGQTAGIKVAYAISAGSATNATKATNADNLTSTLPIGKGGTNATTASAALSNLGGVPTSRTINGKALSSNISLSASDVGARASSWMPSAADVGAVPTSRTVNGKALSSNITLSASDVGARSSSWIPTASDVGAVPTTRTVNGKALSSNITLSAADIGGLTGSRALVSNSSGKIAVSAVTSTELSYLDGVTGAIQTQFNNITTKTNKLNYGQILAPGSAATTCSWTAGAYDFIIVQCYLDETESTAATSAIVPKAFLGSEYPILMSDETYWATFSTTINSLTLKSKNGTNPRLSCVYGVNIVG